MDVPPPAPTLARNGGFSMPLMSSSSSSQPSRKKWRVASEQSVRNSGNEELERSKLGQSDERLIYEHGREPADVDFCSITIDGGVDSDNLQQRLHTVVKKREELQTMEIDLCAQVMARSEIVGMQNTFDTKIKEHADANVKLQEKLHVKEQKLHELERKMEEKERVLHAIRLDNEAAWAKEDILREQSKELQSYRRERDNSEAERIQYIKQIHELQEHIQEKDRPLMELQEQHRIAQETVLFKDEQLREAQAWMTRAQEMDALQSSTNNTLQAELRDRTEHYNQLWLVCQRQFGEMERLHLHIQQLQLELADVREKTSNLDGSHVSQTNLKDVSELGQSNGSQLEVNGNGSPSANSGSPQKGNSESASGGNTPAQADHVYGVVFPPSSLLGMPTYVPTGQVTALHPFVMHQQGVQQPPQIMQSHFHSVSAMPSIQSLQNQQTQPDGQHMSSENQYPRETEQNLLRTDTHYNYKASRNGQILHASYADTNISQQLDADSVAPSLTGERQVFDSILNTYGSTQSPQTLQQISSHFHDALKLDTLEHGNNTKEKQVNPISHNGMENKNTSLEHINPAADASSSEALAYASHTASNADFSDALVSSGQKNNIVGKAEESYLLDERALLASIARTIGSGGKIRISSTLPNRLGRMLAPLKWHDYKNKYGKLDDFVASHPELFFIEGDFIELREGAQETIAATAAVAKVAAAAAGPSLYSSLMPSVALTPMAQSNRSRKASSRNTDKASFTEFAGNRYLNSVNHSSQYSEAENQNVNGGSFHLAGGSSNVSILSKAKDRAELTENRIGSVGKQRSRATGTASNMRR